MKKLLSVVLASILALSMVGCGGSDDKITIAIPNDTTNEARALLLLEDKGYIKVKDDAGITATILDIEENPYDIEFKEVEAAQLPNVLKDVDFAIINSNYAIDAGINPAEEALALEGVASPYGNVLVVKEGNDACILAVGPKMLSLAEKVLEKSDKDLMIVNARSVKPLDDKLLMQIKDKTVITLEENSAIGGFGSLVRDFYLDKGLNVNVIKFGAKDCFSAHGKADLQMSRMGLDSDAISEKIRGM